MLVQLVPLAETWIWKAVAYAASHCSTTWQTVCAEPRSTCSHCGSLKALDHRVPVLPSKAAPAGVPAFSVDDAVAGWPCALLALPHVLVVVDPNTWNSQSEYPYWVARAVPFMRT
jgi:hypothetical protein